MKTQKITFNTNIEKSIEVILWFCAQKKGGINLYNLLKSLFYAEVAHLNKYGRPIIGDIYMAMPHGTVPSLVYDLLKNNELVLRRYHIKHLPFHTYKKHYIIADRHFNEKSFSKSDIICLENAFEKYGHLSFDELEEHNHEHPAWKKVNNESPNSPIPFELLIKDNTLIEELKHISKDMVI